jgi:hypothetical protein
MIRHTTLIFIVHSYQAIYVKVVIYVKGIVTIMRCSFNTLATGLKSF